MVSRGEIYLAELGEPVGREQAGRRPIVVVSAQPWLDAHPPIVAVIPLTRTYRERSTHVEIEKASSGLSTTSYAKCEDLRSISPHRLGRLSGRVDVMAMLNIEAILRRLLAL